MQIRLGKTLAVGWGLGLVSGLAQGFSGAGYGNWGPAGGSYGAVTVARVNVAPVAGVTGAGAVGGAGLTGITGPAAGGGGGLFGVTRPTFMGEANAVAAGFFGRAGVPVTGPGLTPGAAGALVGSYVRGRGSGSAVSVPALPRLAGVGRPATSRPMTAGTAELTPARADRAGPLASPALAPPGTNPAAVTSTRPGFAPRYPVRSPTATDRTPDGSSVTAPSSPGRPWPGK